MPFIFFTILAFIDARLAEVGLTIIDRKKAYLCCPVASSRNEKNSPVGSSVNMPLIFPRHKRLSGWRRQCTKRPNLYRIPSCICSVTLSSGGFFGTYCFLLLNLPARGGHDAFPDRLGSTSAHPQGKKLSSRYLDCSYLQQWNSHCTVSTMLVCSQTVLTHFSCDFFVLFSFSSPRHV